MEHLLPNMIKDFIFDGTMYHLWYLPATAIGAIIAWYLVKKAGMNGAFLVGGLLYIIGMFGDSYYGIAEKVPVIETVYQCIFEVTDYTRNGIFFAPIFILLGGIMAEQSKVLTMKKSVTGVMVCFSLMLGEGMLLHTYGIQRHDSMYIMLVPCMYYLFGMLMQFRGHRNRKLRSMAMVIYIIHPMMILVVRIAAKLFHMQGIFIENSVAHFFAVTGISVVAAMLIVWIYDSFNGKYIRDKKKITDRAWIEIDADNLKHNIEVLQDAMQEDCELMAVVKADAFGHGAFTVATMAERMGVKAFAVATIDEAIALRRYGIRGEILILGYTAPERARELHNFSLTQTLIDYDYAISLLRQKYTIKSHIKINTGMNRLGFELDDIEKIVEIFQAEQLGVCGVYTHLCVADRLNREDVAFTHTQIKNFYHLLHQIQERGIHPGKIHIQSSYGLLNYPELQCDYVRVGIALYGVLSSAKDKTKQKLDLRPVLSLKARVILLRKVQKGEIVGYGRAFTAEKECVIALIAVGYADGIPRNLSCGKQTVLIRGHEVPVAGRICMDQLAVDVTEIPDIGSR